MKLRLDEEIVRKTEFYMEETARLKSVPLSKRVEWIKSKGFADYLSDQKEGLRADQNLGAGEEPSRLLRVSIRRPKGPYRRIAEDVAAAESAERGFKISAATVERFWAEYRALERDLTAEL